MKRSTYSLTVAAFLFAAPQLANADNKPRVVDVNRGEQLAYSHLGAWDDNCRGEDISIKLARRPKHGTLNFKKIKGRIGYSPQGAKLINGSFDKCQGKRIPMIEVSYKADPNFTGNDTALYKVSGPQGTFPIEVQFVVN